MAKKSRASKVDSAKQEEMAGCKSIIDNNKIEFVNLQFTALGGQVKSVRTSSKTFLETAQTGIWFDGSSIEGEARIEESDMHLVPDLSTFAYLPWSKNGTPEARVICDVYEPNGNPFMGDPRQILKRIIAQAQDFGGWELNVGPEIEFFLLNRDNLNPHDNKVYFDYTPLSRADDIIKSVFKAMASFGYQLETGHHEVAPGQHEIDLRFTDALRCADGIITLKMAIKAYAHPGTPFMATFMPKPLAGQNGSGMHMHQSLWKNGKNAFYNSRSKFLLSTIAKQFIAGQLHHCDAITAIANPIPNSYKRLVPGYEAPCYKCWGQTNRSALIRVPANLKAKESTGTRAEMRSPDPFCNPYLAIAALLAAGLDGIRNKMTPPKIVEDDVYQYTLVELKKAQIGMLPATLSESLLQLRNDPIIAAVLGEATLEQYCRLKTAEIEKLRHEITPLEREMYL